MKLWPRRSRPSSTWEVVEGGFSAGDFGFPTFLMNPLEDRVCPSCQVLLPEGTSICVKCGKRVQAQTGIEFVDFVRKIHPCLVEYLGPIAGNLVAGALFVILLIVVVGLHFLVKWLLS